MSDKTFDTPSDDCPEVDGDGTHDPTEPRMMKFEDHRAFAASCKNCGEVLAADGTWF